MAQLAAAGVDPAVVYGLQSEARYGSPPDAQYARGYLGSGSVNSAVEPRGNASRCGGA